MRRPLPYVAALVVLLATMAACNLEEVTLDRAALLGNRRTISGFFDWFRNSYEMRDTSLYGQILNRDFVFQSRDFATGNNTQWERDTEMRVTTNMFRQVRSAKLLWTYYTAADTEGIDTLASVERYFNLSVQVDDDNTYTGTGRARLLLTRPDTLSPWRIRTWVDIRDY